MNAILLQCLGAATTLKCGCDATLGTTWQDVAQSSTAIVLLICVTIAFIACIAIGAVLFWKAKEIKANEDERKFKEEEYSRKQENDWINRVLQQNVEECKSNNDKDDEKRKREIALEYENRRLKAILVYKLLNFLKKQTGKKDTEGNVSNLKSYMAPECRAYIETICDLLKSIQNNKFDVESLKNSLFQMTGESHSMNSSSIQNGS